MHGISSIIMCPNIMLLHFFLSDKGTDKILKKPVSFYVNDSILAFAAIPSLAAC